MIQDPENKMKEEKMLLRQLISDYLIDFGQFYKDESDGITTSDLQGIALSKAIEIIKVIKEN